VCGTGDTLPIFNLSTGAIYIKETLLGIGVEFGSYISRPFFKMEIGTQRKNKYLANKLVIETLN